jgi:hypothetical protein
VISLALTLSDIATIRMVLKKVLFFTLAIFAQVDGWNQSHVAADLTNWVYETLSKID